MSVADGDLSEFDDDPTVSDAPEGKGSILIANVTTGQSRENKRMQIEIEVNNVVCICSLPMHIDLRRVAMNSKDVIYDKARSMLIKQKRNPKCFVKVYASGSVYITGCRSEEDCKKAARGVGRMVQRGMDKLGAPIRLRDFRISNMMALCRLPFGIRIEDLAGRYPQASYEPELTVGLVWKTEDPKATLRIHTTGTISITGATSSSDAVRVIEQIYPIVEEFGSLTRSHENSSTILQRRRPAAPMNNIVVAPKQPRRAPILNPASSDLYEDGMQDEEERWYRENYC